MGVHISGMEMPKSCESCPCKTADAFGGLGCQATGYIPLRKANQSRPDWCPLVPVQPHGRLIDADALKIEVFAHDKLMKDGWNNMDMGMFTGNLMEVIAGAPTIIESEEGET